MGSMTEWLDESATGASSPRLLMLGVRRVDAPGTGVNDDPPDNSEDTIEIVAGLSSDDQVVIFSSKQDAYDPLDTQVRNALEAFARTVVEGSVALHRGH